MEDLVTEHAAVPGVFERLFLLLKGIFSKTNLFLTSQLQLMPHLRELKIPHFIVTHVPVGHNYTFRCLLDHLRRLSLLHSFVSLKSSPKKQIILQLVYNWTETQLYCCLCSSYWHILSYWALKYNCLAGPALTGCLRCEAVPTRQRDNQEFYQSQRKLH